MIIRERSRHDFLNEFCKHKDGCLPAGVNTLYRRSLLDLLNHDRIIEFEYEGERNEKEVLIRSVTYKIKEYDDYLLEAIKVTDNLRIEAL